MQGWLNTFKNDPFTKSAKSRHASSLHFIYLLIIFSLLQSVSAQSLDVATRLIPWPPPGWPEGAQGEVKLVTQAEGEKDIGIAFPIGEAGRSHLPLS